VIGLAAYVAVVLVLLAIAVARIPSTVDVALESELVPEPVDGLGASDLARLEAWTRELEAMGFVRIGDFRVAEKAESPSAMKRAKRLRGWISPDGGSFAYALHVAVVAGEAARTQMLLAFLSRRDARLFTTHNTAEDDALGPPPGVSTRRHPRLLGPRALHEAHLRHAADRDRLEPGMLAPSFLRLAKLEIDHGVSRGLLEIRGDRAHATLRHGLRAAARFLVPLTESGRGWAVAARLAALAAAWLALAGSVPALVTPPWVRWATSGVFALSFVVTCLAFPNTGWMTWAYAIAPAVAWMEATGRRDWVPGALGPVAGGCVHALVVQAQSRAVARRIGAARPGEDPATEAARWVVFLTAAFLGASIGLAAYAWQRSPRDEIPLWITLAAIPLLGLAALFLVVTGILSWLPGTKSSPGFRIVNAASFGVVLAVAGVVAGSWTASRDDAETRRRAGPVVEALERHRSERGSYPAALQSLAPSYLADIPAAGRESFAYRLDGPEYVLSYRSPSGRVEWRPSIGAWMPAR
jgi:hypothetical protein